MSIWYERHKLHAFVCECFAGSAVVVTFNSLFQTHYERETLFEDRLKSYDSPTKDFVIGVHRLAAVGI